MHVYMYLCIYTHNFINMYDTCMYKFYVGILACVLYMSVCYACMQVVVLNNRIIERAINDKFGEW